LAVNYIHSHKIIHRDIKLENFLYESESSGHMKLIDFGFSKILSAQDHRMKLACGTLAYVAPEVLTQSYDYQADLWSLGVVVFILLFGYMPFSGPEHVVTQAIRNGDYKVKKEIWARISVVAQDFVKKLLVVDPKVRLNAEAALKHAWIERIEAKSHKVVVDQSLVDALVGFGQASKFRRACLSVMAWSLTNEERSVVRDAFIKIDEERNGTVKLSEFKHLIMDQFQVADEMAMQAFHALDTNQDDEIHYSDFLAAIIPSRIRLHEDLLKTAFHRFDIDNSGSINCDDLKVVLGDTFSTEEIEQFMAEADYTHDGQISYSEWIDYVRCGEAEDTQTDAAARIIDTTLRSPDNKRKPTITLRAEEVLQLSADNDKEDEDLDDERTG